MTNDEYIKWFNNLPVKGELGGYNPNPPLRACCPDCKEPVFATKDEKTGDVYIDLKHKETCMYGAGFALPE